MLSMEFVPADVSCALGNFHRLEYYFDYDIYSKADMQIHFLKCNRMCHNYGRAMVDNPTHEDLWHLSHHLSCGSQYNISCLQQSLAASDWERFDLHPAKLRDEKMERTGQILTAYSFEQFAW